MQKSSFELDPGDLAPLIHQAVLGPHINNEELLLQCDLAKHFEFSGLCTSLDRLSLARERLGISGKTKLISVVGFPFGSIPKNLKCAEAEYAASSGADELDLVPNFSALHEEQGSKFADELGEICSLGLPVRVILDLAGLPVSSIQLAIEAAIDVGVIGIQTGNGFGRIVDSTDIHLVKSFTKEKCSIKAVGGIKEIHQAITLLKSGATILGTTHGHQIMKSLKSFEK